MKIGLSLGGGGAKGAYHVGVLKALEEFNLIDSISLFSGVSIGAINAYFYLSSEKSQTVYDAWLYGINNKIFKEESAFKRNKELGGFYNIDIIKEIAKKFLDEKLFKKSNKDLYVVLTKVSKPRILELIKRSTRKKVIVHVNKKKTPLDFVVSSASVPVVFGFQKLEEDYYVDGGISDNNTIDVLIEKGAEIIFHSSFDNRLDLNEFSNKNVTLIELTSMYAMPYFRLSRFLSSADFDLELFEKRVKYGYFVTKSMIKYLIDKKILIKKDEKLLFNETFGSFNNITIPEEIQEEVRKMYKEK